MTTLNSHSSQSTILWLKSEPFAIGSLSCPPSPRLTVNVRRLFDVLSFVLYVTDIFPYSVALF